MKRVAARRRYHSPAGRLTQIPDLHSPHRQQSSACNANHILRCNGRIYCCESEPEDGKGPYTTTSFCKGTRASSNVLNAPSPMATKAAAASATYRKAPAEPLMPRLRGAMVEKTAAFSNERKINAKQALRASAAWLLPSLVAPLSTV